MIRATALSTILLLASTGAWAVTGDTTAAAAITGVTITGGPMSAGPNASYPTFERLSAGLDVTIYGCLAGWDWCDVSWRGVRGWVPAATLAYNPSGSRVLVTSPGLRPGLPVVAFHFRAYWDENYSGRTWFTERVQ